MSRFVALRIEGGQLQHQWAGDDLQQVIDQFVARTFSEDDDLYVLDTENDGIIVASWNFEEQKWDVSPTPTFEALTVKWVLRQDEDFDIKVGETFSDVLDSAAHSLDHGGQPMACFMGSDNQPYCLSTNSSIDPANPDAFKDHLDERKEEGEISPDDLAATGFYTSEEIEAYRAELAESAEFAA